VGYGWQEGRVQYQIVEMDNALSDQLPHESDYHHSLSRWISRPKKAASVGILLVKDSLKELLNQKKYTPLELHDVIYS